MATTLTKRQRRWLGGIYADPSNRGLTAKTMRQLGIKQYATFYSLMWQYHKWINSEDVFED